MQQVFKLTLLAALRIWLQLVKIYASAEKYSLFRDCAFNFFKHLSEEDLFWIIFLQLFSFDRSVLNSFSSIFQCLRKNAADLSQNIEHLNALPRSKKAEKRWIYIFCDYQIDLRNTYKKPHEAKYCKETDNEDNKNHQMAEGGVAL